MAASQFNLTVGCAIDQDCSNIVKNAVCSRSTNACICNPWYGWEGPTCEDVSSTASKFIIITWSILLLVSACSSIFGVWDFFRARKSFLENVKTTVRVNAAMSTTLSAICAMWLLAVWSALSIASILVVSKDVPAPEVLQIVSFGGRYESVSMFVAPLAFAMSAISLMRTALMWIEIAARSRSMRPVIGANFRRTTKMLVLQHVLLLCIIVACWSVSFGLVGEKSMPSIWVIFALGSLPVSLVLLISFCIGSAQLKAVLIQARKTVYEASGENQASTGVGRRPFFAATLKRISKSSDNFATEGGQPPAGYPRNSASSDGEQKSYDRRPSEERRSKRASTGYERKPVSDGADATQVKQGGSERNAPFQGFGGNAMRASRWNRHAKLVHQTNLVVVAIVLIGMCSMGTFAVLDFIYGWRDSPVINNQVSLELVVFMVAPVCLTVSQVVILAYVHIASSKSKAGTPDNSAGPSRRRTTFFWRSSLTGGTPKERQGSLVAFEPAVTANPAYGGNAMLKKTLSHIREEPRTAYPSFHSQHTALPHESSPKAESRRQPSRPSLYEQSPSIDEEEQTPTQPVTRLANGATFSSFGSMIAEKSDETESADSGIVLMIDDLLPPPSVL